MNIKQLHMLEMLRKSRLSKGFGYRRKDIVLHLDGIQNTRAGYHNPNATVWEDLAGNMDITLYNATWGENYCSFSGNTGSYGIGDYWTFIKGYTMEVVLTPITLSENGDIMVGFSSAAAGTPIDATRAYFQLRNSGYLQLRFNGIRYVALVFPKITTIQYIGANNTIARKNGFIQQHTESLVPLGKTHVPFILGGCFNNSSLTISSSFSFHGHIHAVRVYDAYLTEDELQAHWLIDKERFNIPEGVS